MPSPIATHTQAERLPIVDLYLGRTGRPGAGAAATFASNGGARSLQLLTPHSCQRSGR